MAIDKLHPEIEKTRPIWEKIRDFKEGERVVKTKGKKYCKAVNKTMDKSDDLYEAYIYRGIVQPATTRAIEANAGMILRQSPQISKIEIDYIKENLNGSGQNLNEFITALTEEICTTQFAGIFVDYSKLSEVEKSGKKLTQAELKRLNKRAYAIIYPAESIINWGLGSDKRLRFVIVSESYNKYEDDDKDKLNPRSYNQYRMLIKRNGIVYNEVYRKESNEYECVESDPFILKNKYLSEIPFIFCNGKDNTPVIYNPRMEDIANLNNIDYIDHVDFKWLLHFAAAPTPYVTGIQKEDKVNQIGPNIILKLNNADAKVGVMEINGNSFTALENNLKSNSEKLSGAMINTLGLSRTDETATKERHDFTAKTVSLKDIALSISSAVNKTIEWIYIWEDKKTEKDDVVVFNTDFVPVNITAQELSALTQAVINGTMPLEQYYYNLHKGGKIKPDTTIEDYKDQIIAGGGNPENVAEGDEE